MGALDLGLPWSFHTHPVNQTRLRNVIITGAAVATFVLTRASPDSRGE
jgi:hypothetical protein